MWTNDFNKQHARDLIAEHYPNPSELQSNVSMWILDRATDYDECATAWDNIAGLLSDLAYGGCSSGMVSHLIYNSDILRYWEAHREEITDTIQTQADDSGCGIGELFRAGDWDNTDPFCRELPNITIMVWAAFEQTAFDIGCAMGIEL